MTNKAYSILTVNKQYTDEETNERVITGTATTPAADRVNDVINPLGITFQNPLPLLFHHDHEKPVGTVYFENPTETGIKFVARIADIQEPGLLKDRCDEAWQSVKAQLVRGVSIGFRPTGDVEYIKNGGILYKTCEVFELSLVTIPCNAQATIELIKSLDTSASAIDKDDVEKQESNSEIKSKESETARQLDSENTKCVNAENTKYIKVSYKNDSKIIKNNNKGMTTMKFAEQIKNVKSARADKVKAMQDIMSEQVTLDDEQNAQYETLESEVKSLDAQLKRLEDLEKMSASEATDVEVSKAYKPQVLIKTQKDAAPGVAFARIAGALAQAKGNVTAAAEITKRFSDTPAVHEFLKNKSIGMTDDEAWASPLVQESNIVDEFVELLRPASVMGKIQGFRTVPFNTKIVVQTNGTSANWVGESQEIGKTGMGFSTVSLNHSKVAAIVPISAELARFSNPSAELAVRDDLIKAITHKVDNTLFDFDAVESSDNPGSLTANASLIVNSGETAENVEADLESLFPESVRPAPRNASNLLNCMAI
jgi:HK97 family phage major capsid protein/HK97 family phage prohead protease